MQLGGHLEVIEPTQISEGPVRRWCIDDRHCARPVRSDHHSLARCPPVTFTLRRIIWDDGKPSMDAEDYECGFRKVFIIESDIETSWVAAS